MFQWHLLADAPPSAQNPYVDIPRPVEKGQVQTERSLLEGAFILYMYAMWCDVMSCHVMWYIVMSCHVMSCHVCMSLCVCAFTLSTRITPVLYASRPSQIDMRRSSRSPGWGQMCQVALMAVANFTERFGSQLPSRDDTSNLSRENVQPRRTVRESSLFCHLRFWSFGIIPQNSTWNSTELYMDGYWWHPLLG